jgi:schlafen family protein
MTDEELRQRLSDYEDGWTERKEQGVSTEDISKALVAFANSLPEGEEGTLFIGVSDKGEPRGVDNPDKMQKRVRRLATDWCYPPIHQTSRVFEESGKHIVAVIVHSSKDKPHFAGPAFVRKGSESVNASEKLFEELIASRNSKVRAILVERDRGNIVTVEMKPGNFRHMCKVVECDSNRAIFRNDSTGEIIAAALSQITISFNTFNNTTMFVIVPDR